MTTTPPDEAAAITLRKPVALSRLAATPVPVPLMARAMLTGTKARAAATLHQNVRVVRIFSSSARIRSVIGLLLRES